jgi:hypothetical protein
LEAHNAQKSNADEKNADQIERLSVRNLTDLIPKVVGNRTAIILIDALVECVERLDFLKAIKSIMGKHLSRSSSLSALHRAVTPWNCRDPAQSGREDAYKKQGKEPDASAS